MEPTIVKMKDTTCASCHSALTCIYSFRAENVNGKCLLSDVKAIPTVDSIEEVTCGN